MADPSKTATPMRRAVTGVTALFAILSCPCHLPILLLLLSGTTAGALLSENLSVAVLALLPIFVLSLVATWRLLGSNEAGTSGNN